MFARLYAPDARHPLGHANLFTVTEDARIVKTPDGLLLLGWSLVKPGWRVNVKRFPVGGSKAVHKERVRSKAEAEHRITDPCRWDNCRHEARLSQVGTK